MSTTRPRRKKIWLVLDRKDVATLLLALEVLEAYLPAGVTAEMINDENRLYELLRERLAAHDLGRKSRV